MRMMISPEPPAVPGLPGDIHDFWRHYVALRREGLVPTLRDFLDSAPYRFMPRVAIADMVGPDDFVMRFYGTALTDLSGTDWTGMSARESERRGMPIQTGSRGWTAVNHPCGYLSTRAFLRRERPLEPEVTFELTTLALPLTRPGETAQCMLNYNSLPHFAGALAAAAAKTVGQAITPLHWVDIGAGIPQD